MRSIGLSPAAAELNGDGIPQSDRRLQLSRLVLVALVFILIAFIKVE